MAISKYFKPINDKHSIKEVVITIFLSNKIENPSSFADLLRTDFSNTFDEFSILKEHRVNIGSDGVESFEMDDNVGFVFSKKENEEKFQYVLQGKNEKQRTFLSFHMFNYNRWEDFFNLFKSILDPIIKKHDEFQIEAFNLHYIDEFIWYSKESINLRLLFNPINNEFLPLSFFNKSFPRMYLSFTTSSDEITYTDSINIMCLPAIPDTIVSISHLGSHQLREPINISDLLQSKLFDEKIHQAHNQNKTLLKSLLTQEAQSLINLPSS